MTPEGKVKEHLKKAIQKVGGTLRKLSYEGRAGAPDWLVLFPALGLFWMVELKAPGKKPTEHQLREHDVLRRSGIHVHVVDGTEAIARMMEEELSPSGKERK